MLDPIKHVDFVTKRRWQILPATMLRRPHDVLCAQRCARTQRVFEKFQTRPLIFDERFNLDDFTSKFKLASFLKVTRQRRTPPHRSHAMMGEMSTADGSKQKILRVRVHDPNNPPWLDPEYRLRPWEIIINRYEKTTSHPPDATQAGHPVTSGTSNQINHASASKDEGRHDDVERRTGKGDERVKQQRTDGVDEDVKQRDKPVIQSFKEQSFKEKLEKLPKRPVVRIEASPISKERQQTDHHRSKPAVQMNGSARGSNPHPEHRETPTENALHSPGDAYANSVKGSGLVPRFLSFTPNSTSDQKHSPKMKGVMRELVVAAKTSQRESTRKNEELQREKAKNEELTRKIEELQRENARLKASTDSKQRRSEDCNIEDDTHPAKKAKCDDSTTPDQITENRHRPTSEQLS